MAALFTNSKRELQPKYPSVERNEEQLIHLNTGIHSAIKKKTTTKVMPLTAAWMDQEIYPSERSQGKKYYITYRWNL